MIHVFPHEIANEIRMARSQYAGAFLIVEGQDDYKFMLNFISLSTCKIEVARGKQNVCEVIAHQTTCGATVLQLYHLD